VRNDPFHNARESGLDARKRRAYHFGQRGVLMSAAPQTTLRSKLKEVTYAALA
jgi:hypothetical protein